MADSETLLAIAKSIVKDDIKKCSIPYSNYANETAALATRAGIDKDELTARGLAPEAIDNLLVWVGLLLEAIGHVEGVNSALQAKRDQWDLIYPDALKLRSEIEEEFEFAYKNSVSVHRLIVKEKEGDSIPDTIKDFYTLNEIGTSYPDELTKTNFDFTLLTKGLETAKELQNLRAEIDGNQYLSSDALVLRNQIYTAMKKEVDEVRSTGQFVYRKDEEKRQLYSSKYQRDRSAAYRRSKKTEQAPDDHTAE